MSLEDICHVIILYLDQINYQIKPFYIDRKNDMQMFSTMSNIDEEFPIRDKIEITQKGKRGWICHNCSFFNFNCKINKIANRLCLVCKTNAYMTPRYPNPHIFASNNNYCSYEPIHFVKTVNKSIKSNLVFKKGDWYCLNCKNLNFRHRIKCNRCDFNKSHLNGNDSIRVGNNIKP